MVLSSRMVLYNITVIIEDKIQREWLEWMNSEFIPAAMNTGLFSSKRLLTVLGSPNEGITYCLQLIAENIGSFHDFKQHHEPAIMAAHASRFANSFVSFSTLMEFVD